MTDKELKLMDYVISAIGSIHDSIAEADVRPLANALRKLTAMQILIEAPEMKKPLEYETPEQPKLDKVALDIINEPIADEVPLDHHERNVRAYMHDFNVSRETAEKELTVEPEPKIPRAKRVAVNDFDTPLDVKDAGTSRDEKIFYYRTQGKTLAWIAKMVGCAPQTVANVINRKKEKEAAKAKSEASYAHIMNGGKA